MSENKNVCDVCGSGSGRCGQCGNMCGWSGNNVLRWILGIIIITWVFCVGMRFGQMTAYYEGGGYGYRNHMYYGAMPMMQGTYPVGGAPSGGVDVIYSSNPVRQ